jgi:hypothetical protein
MAQKGNHELGDEIQQARLRVDAVGAVYEKVAEQVELALVCVEGMQYRREMQRVPSLLRPRIGELFDRGYVEGCSGSFPRIPRPSRQVMQKVMIRRGVALFREVVEDDAQGKLERQIAVSECCQRP